MKLARPLAASGVALAAVAATLGAVAPAAQAAPVTATYSCDFPLVGTRTLTLDINANLPGTAAAGIPVGAGLLHLPVTAKTASDVAPALGLIQADGAVVKDFASTIGNVTVKVPAKFGAGAVVGSELQFTGEGVNEAFRQPAAGTYNITLPKSFTITPTKGGADIAGVTVPCSTATPVKLGTIKIDKQLGHVSAKASKKAVKKKKASIAVSVANDWSAKGGVIPTGKVVVKKGKKTVGTSTLVNGKATVKLKKLKKGVNKVTVTYLGDGYTSAAKSKVVKVKVK
jgi:hypothetical protein